MSWERSCGIILASYREENFIFNQIYTIMNGLNHQLPKVIYLTICMSMLIVGCNNSSHGNKETQQKNNDNDPTKIEQPRGQDSLQMKDRNTNQVIGTLQNLDNDSDIVVMQNFNDPQWEKFKTERNFGSGENFNFQNINTGNIGGESWKSWENYQYRIIYYSENGSLKAKPLLRTADNKHIQLTQTAVDSLALKGLWDQIQNEVSETKKSNSGAQ